MDSERVERLTWVDDSGTGFENLVVTYGAGRITAAGHVVGPAETPFEVDYLVQCDESWRTRLVRVTDAAHGRYATLYGDGEGNWTDESGNAVSAAAGAIDVDISATPFTNTLPIRRVALPIGRHIDVVTAYIAIPELVVSGEVQRYTRIAHRTYRFESRDSDFTRDITVDGEGFVLDYPGLFTRRFHD
jgi:hypothetical protein